VSAPEVALDRYTHSQGGLLYRWNHLWQGEEKGRDVFPERIEVEYYHARSQNHHLAVVRLICILSFLCGRNSGEWCQHWCRNMSSSSKDTIDQDQCFLSKMNCCNNVKNRLDSLLPTHIITSRLSSDQAAPRFTFSKKGSYHSCRISLILLHTFAKCLLALSISTSLGSRKAYCICVQLVMVIVLHPHKTLLRPMPDWWLSLYVKFVHYMNLAFSLDTDSATSSRGTRTRARTNKWDMTAEHALSCHCDGLKCSVDESGRLDDAKQIAS
jgi:hypothetical protein